MCCVTFPTAYTVFENKKVAVYMFSFLQETVQC